MKRLLLPFADAIGMSRWSNRLVAFWSWPKDRRIRYWASDVSKVVRLRARKTRSGWIRIRVFLHRGGKEDCLVSIETLEALRGYDFEVILVSGD